VDQLGSQSLSKDPGLCQSPETLQVHRQVLVRIEFFALCGNTECPDSKGIKTPHDRVPSKFPSCKTEIATEIIASNITMTRKVATKGATKSSATGKQQDAKGKCCIYSDAKLLSVFGKHLDN
jgi:hypothetical protein